MHLDVRGDIREVEQHLSGLAQRQVPFATALALTRTAQFAGQKLREELARSLDRPKPYTLNSMFVTPATKERLWSEVRIKDHAVKSTPPVKWLQAEVRGGQRRHKAFELALIRRGVMPPNAYAVPTRLAPMDDYGNLEPSEINRMLSDLQARRDPLQNTTPASRGRRMRSRTKRATFYFSTYPVTKRTQHLPAGIYRRLHFGFGAAIQPILLFVSKARYSKRVRFYETAEQVANMRFPLEFTLAMREALRTAR